MSTLKRCRAQVLLIEELLAFHASTANEFLLEEAYEELTRICVWIVEGKYTLKAGYKALCELRESCHSLEDDEEYCPFLDDYDAPPDDSPGATNWKPILPGEEK